ncbi:glycosyltransferase [Couchioplanes caeruleus]|uniref:Glycosyltransferase family 1 protein n=2 Tax=Couchioplanes caeruleus TaxID=56438 RepID=A0A1K0FPJ3_9ACTN|nr:glycosyltransferase [Couchioplanes caeruleus]OJF14713.1 hypothetical protein BG844_08360 [Couchioplanes caeruleus subsp. caeruleus]OJF15961.1 hypothetical protein BG844_01630 [Couchioplanes caeruleus subsp. caeruleus]ROP28552.1 hypothetical protein EDD30_1316 [Couchioplanes caeruleus]
MNRLRIVVSGLVGLYPLGGVAWDYLQYMIGLARLGHDVYYHEDTWRWPYQPVDVTFSADGTYSAAFIAGFLADWAPELAERWHYVHLAAEHHGMSATAFRRVARTADVFLNISGGSAVPEELPAGAARVFVDTDPGVNQIMLRQRLAWADDSGPWAITSHDRFFTYGENLGGAQCRVPVDDFPWRTTRMPVVTALWRDLPPVPRGAPWSTVTTWNAFGHRIVLDGVEYRSKDAEFERLIDLPRRVPVPVRVALGGLGAPGDRLRAYGWQVVDAPAMTISARSYRDFIGGSRGELTPVKEVYTALRTGWFSTRSACYLAAGRPVVVQQTGLPAALPVGEGILVFTCPEEAAEAVCRVEGDYDRHATAARRVAEDYFGASGVLRRLLSDLDA